MIRFLNIYLTKENGYVISGSLIESDDLARRLGMDNDRLRYVETVRVEIDEKKIEALMGGEIKR